MGIEHFWENKDLPTVKQHVGMLSIDTIERMWDVIYCEGKMMVLAFREAHDSAILGRIAIRDDGKYCFAFELRVQIDPQYGLCEMEPWHISAADIPARSEVFKKVLKDAGLIK